MRMPARIQPLLPVILGGLVVTLVVLYLFARFSGFSHPLNRNYSAVSSEILQVATVSAFRNAPVSQPSSGLVAQDAVNGLQITTARAPLKLVAKLRYNNRAFEPASIPLTRPFSRASQLIRTATLDIQVQNVDRAVHAASGIVDGELGDIINLDYRSSSQGESTQTATMEVRVPQYRFENTLDQLAALGKVTTRTVGAQDVADQIVDAQARLRNLRHTEADMLKIMDRYGDIDQVLRVTQELSNVREQIETLDAQLKGMQYQVAYSTITINFLTPFAIAKPPAGVGILTNAWHAALVALEGLTIGLLSFGLWLVAFSPYVLLLGLLVVLTLRRVRVRSAVS